MDRPTTLKRLAEHQAPLGRVFGVARLALFGSVAPDAATPASDVDILVGFDGPATSERYFGVQFDLEDLLRRPVNPVSEKALLAEWHPSVENEALHV